MGNSHRWSLNDWGGYGTLRGKGVSLGDSAKDDYSWKELWLRVV